MAKKKNKGAATEAGAAPKTPEVKVESLSAEEQAAAAKAAEEAQAAKEAAEKAAKDAEEKEKEEAAAAAKKAEEDAVKAAAKAAKEAAKVQTQSIASDESVIQSEEAARKASRSDAKFKLDGEVCEFKIHKFNLDGKEWTASELMKADEKERNAVLANLKSIKSGVIGPVKGE